MFREYFFRSRKVPEEKKNEAGPSKKKNDKKDIVKNKVLTKPVVDTVAVVKVKHTTLKRGYESSKDSASLESARPDSSASLLVSPMETSAAPLTPTTKATVSPTKKDIPKKFSADVDSLNSGLQLVKDCLRRISPFTKSPKPAKPASIPDMVTPMEPHDRLTPLLAETPVRHLPKYRLRTVRRRLFQDDSSSSNSSIMSIHSGMTEITQSNEKATVSSSQSFESEFEINISMASISPVYHMDGDGESDEGAWRQLTVSPPEQYKDTSTELFSSMEDGDGNGLSEKDVQSSDILSLADKSTSISFLDRAVGDICTISNSKTESSWSDARTPEKECTPEFWSEKILPTRKSMKSIRHRSRHRIMFPTEDIYYFNELNGNSKKLNRRLSFSSQKSFVLG